MQLNSVKSQTPRRESETVSPRSQSSHNNIITATNLSFRLNTEHCSYEPQPL